MLAFFGFGLWELLIIGVILGGAVVVAAIVGIVICMATRKR